MTWILTAVSAGLLAFSQPGFGVHILAWFGFSLFLLALETKTPAKGFWLGLFFGLVYFGVGFSWIVPTFMKYIPQVFQSFPPVVGLGIFVLLCLFESLFFGLFGVFFALFRHRLRKHPLLALAWIPLLLFCTEWLRGWGPMGFPGMRFSDSLAFQVGILQLARFGGSGVLLLLLGFSNAFFFHLFRSRKSLFSIWPAICLVAAVYLLNPLSSIFLPAVSQENSEPTLDVAVFQLMMSPEEKYSITLRENLARLESELQQLQDPVDVAVFPEAVFIQDIRRYPPVLEELERISQERGFSLIVPSPVYEKGADETLYYNTVLCIQPQGGMEEFFYAKRKLNPFTESLPFESIFGIFGFLRFSEYYQPGPEYLPFSIKGAKVAFPICFESFYPEVFEGFRQNGAQAFAVVTNDGWFDNERALTLHFAQIPFRAVETRSWSMQVSNNGITGIVDPYGRVVKTLPPFQNTFSVFSIPLSSLHEASLAFSILGFEWMILWFFVVISVALVVIQ
ncbi:MAG TPA: apolipoprotein N-acyltransferase [Thermotogota bacterium]|nr:apolipoprotein N-acyltransferase [Thermotogota bacterium]HRW91687.1 apolipoprotein N-acyltransferase [Thermotogota bacterium]